MSLTIPCVSETFKPRLSKNTVRPLSLDLSYLSSKTSTDSISNTSSSSNSLLLTPRRRMGRIYSLQEDKPPPRSSLGPKPARFKALSEDSKLSSGNQMSKSSVEVVPTIQVTRHVEVTTEGTAVAKDNDDNLSLDDVFVDNAASNAQPKNFVSLNDEQIKFIDEATPNITDIETRSSNTGIIDSDMVSHKSVPMECSDRDSQVDVHSESSVDTVATVIEVRNRTTIVDSMDVRNVSDNNMFIIHNPSYDSLNTYELLSTERKLSGIDESNPKLAKDMKNKLSKESTQRLSKNLAAEITDFFKSSASKLKPPCLDQAKKDLANKKIKIDRDIAEPCFKTPLRLIPRSPYITTVPLFEKSLPRKGPSVKQPPFYVWNINSKNAAVCTTLNPPSNYRISANNESKVIKDIENSTRKILDMAKRSNGANTSRKSPTKTTEKDAKSASTGHLATKPQRESKMSHAQSNVLKPKPRLFSSINKTGTNSRPSPNRLLVPKASPWISPTKTLHSKPIKFPMKNPSKINIPLPSPHITVTKVKTQLPCDFTTSGTCNNITKTYASTSDINNLPNVTVIIEPGKKKSWVKKWRSMIHDLFRKHHVELYINGVPPYYNFKRSNTWPPKTKPCADDSSMYMRFK